MSVFTYAKLSKYDLGLFRLLGHGLGNLMFPWARSIVVARKYNLRPIWPTWPQIKIGPWLRAETDKRLYQDLFCPTSEYIVGLNKLYFLLKLSHIKEQSFLGKKDSALLNNGIIYFEGFSDFFREILKDHEIVRQELLKIVHQKHKTGMEHDFREAISVHVRLGDFSVPENESILSKGSFDYRIPFSWYKSVIYNIRNTLNKNMKVYIFSDGSDSELGELLALPNCFRITFGSSIADLIALSRAHVLITSGSTFSYWASYLGRMPVIWFPGLLKEKLYYENEFAETELGYNNIPSARRAGKRSASRHEHYSISRRRSSSVTLKKNVPPGTKARIYCGISQA